MGEVYRAADTKLGREVALKMLPFEFAQDAERLARFEREAKLLASLNHPNIAHVYGFESATLPDGSSAHFLAMELVEGEDLAVRLKRGPIPVDEALPIARQIAEALEEAHERSIVHRDLKPANIKITPDGQVKVLDFGLAKVWTGDGAGGTSSADLSQSPTLAHTGTAAGLILGTAAYMSPEQARGNLLAQALDHRTLAVSGDPVAVAEDVWRNPTTDGLTAFSVAEDGTLACRRGGRAIGQLTWLDRQGQRLGTVGPPAILGGVALSPDDRRVLVHIKDPARDTGPLFVLDAATGMTTRVTFGAGNQIRGLYSPDGRLIVFSSDS